MHGLKPNSKYEARSWSCRSTRARIQMYWTCKCSREFLNASELLILQLFYSTEASNSNDKIWRVAQQVGNDCSSAMVCVCRAFKLAYRYRIMKKITDHDGDDS
jgi:hypothetical protein